MDKQRLKSIQSLNWVQGLGAFNDNLFRWLATYFLIDLMPEHEGLILSVGGALFVIPFILFSDVAGVISDRISKSVMIRKLKILELVAMVIGVSGFYFHSPVLLAITLTLMCVQSAFFGPAKYGIVPELAPTEALSKVNSRFALFTFIAIIAGSASAALLSYLLKPVLAHLSWLCVLTAALGLWASYGIEIVKKAGGKAKMTPLFFYGAYRTLRPLTRKPYMLAAIAGLSGFWLISAFLNMQLIPFGQEVLGVEKESAGLMFLLVAFGVAGGSWVAGRVSGRLIEFGIVPIGAFGMSVSLLSMYWCESVWLMIGLLYLMGFSAGLYTLPLNAFLQWQAPEDSRGSIMAATNFCNFTAMLGSAVLFYLFKQSTLAVETALALAGVATALVALFALVLLPDFLIRLAVVAVAKTRFRIGVEGDRMPVEGGCFLEIGDLSMWQRLTLMVNEQRRICFVVPRSQYTWWNRYYFRLMRILPDDSPDLAERMTAVLNGGRVVAAPTILPGLTAPAYRAEIERTSRGLLLRDVVKVTFHKLSA